MAIWTNNVGIFEDKGTWVTNNTPHHVTNGIDISDFTADGTDYIIPIVTKIGVVEDENIMIMNLAGRINFKISIGSGQAVVTMTCLCLDDTTSMAETKINNILEFIRRHDKMVDNDIYLVVSRLVNSTRYYIEFENVSDAYNINYMQCAITSGRPKMISYGVWEIVLQCEEVNT